MTNDTIGIDISKATLDAHRLSDGASAQFNNTKAGFAALQRWLKSHDIARIVYEPTGPYHRAFEVAMATQFPLVKVNPLQARRFAQAHGVRAKTDKVDAPMLAVMGQAFSLEPQASASNKQRNLKELNVARQALIKDRTRALNRQKTLTLPILKRQAIRFSHHDISSFRHEREDVSSLLPRGLCRPRRNVIKGIQMLADLHRHNPNIGIMRLMPTSA